MLPRRGAALLEGGVNLLVGALMTLVAFFSVGFIRLGLDQRSPGLQIPMAIVYSALFLLATVTSLFAFSAALGVRGRGRSEGPSA